MKNQNNAAAAQPKAARKVYAHYYRFSVLGRIGFECQSGSGRNGTLRRIRVEGNPEHVLAFARLARAIIRHSDTVAKTFASLEKAKTDWLQWRTVKAGGAS